jgi:hypothetical protein
MSYTGGFSNYDAANMLVKASRPRLVQLLRRAHNPSKRAAADPRLRSAVCLQCPNGTLLPVLWHSSPVQALNTLATFLHSTYLALGFLAVDPQDARTSCSVPRNHLTEGRPLFLVPSGFLTISFLQVFISSDLNSWPSHVTLHAFNTFLTSASLYQWSDGKGFESRQGST